jgi:ABC-type uncharacterized transport system permease subunit
MMLAMARKLSAWLVLLSLTLSGSLYGVACQSEDVADQFRTASAEALATGFKSIADGLIDGLFAVFQPDSGSASSASGQT